MRARSCCCAVSGFWPAWWRRPPRGRCRRTRRPSATPAFTAPAATANHSCRARSWAAAPAVAITPTATMPFTSCPTRAISRPNSPRRAFRSWSRSSRCAPIPAAPASAAAGSRAAVVAPAAGEPVLAGQIVRVVTTGGGGWGDPLEREPDLVQRDVIEGKVSLSAARDDYGVVLNADGGKERFAVDEAATAALRGKLKAARTKEPLMID